MNYSRSSIRKKLEYIDKDDRRFANRISGGAGTAIVFAVVLFAVSLCFLCLGAVVGIIENSPDIKDISPAPTGFASKTYDINGKEVATLVKSGSNREEASFEEFPEDLVNAFVAIEDRRFFEHDGIDLRSITRAVKGVITGNSEEGGGSTITQQLVKNNVFAGGMEEGFALYERKFQEWYIALSLENQPGKKKQEIKREIITDYLNTINLSNNTLGVKVAARRYFDKELSELDLSECTVLAAITKNPSRLNPIRHPDNNQERRIKVLENMRELGYITKEQEKAASSMDVYDEIEKVNSRKTETDQGIYSWFTDELINQCVIALKEKLSITEKEARDLLYSGGLSIYTTQDPAIQKIVDEEVNNPDNYDTVKYSYKWRLSLTHSDGTMTHYSERDSDKYIEEHTGNYTGLFKDRETIEKWIDEYRDTVITSDDTVTAETLDFTLEPQVGFVVIDQKTGYVKAVSGGRGDKEYSLTINRATNTYRQPGSTFKVITAFAPAIEENGATLGTVYYDARYQVGEKEFRNWWNHTQFFGWSGIREGIEYSMNIVAVRCLVETVSPEAGAEFAKKMGITTLYPEDVNAALALGGITKGVSLLELTNAFSAIADGGNYCDYCFFTKITDKNGNVLIDNTETVKKRVMKETTAWLLTDAMRASTVGHSKWAYDYSVNNTSSRSHLDNMICAGKSGTTTNNRDAWFVGFTPYYTAGIWAGCDDNQSLNDSQTGEYNGGTSFHKDIWNRIMTRVHAELSDPGSFEKPDDITEKRICRKSGLLAGPYCELDVRGGSSPVYTEYFDIENVPYETCNIHTEDGTVYINEENLQRGETDDVRANAAILAAKAAAEEEALLAQQEEEAVLLGPGSMPYGPGSQMITDNYER